MEKSGQPSDVSTTSTNGVATDIAPLRTEVQPQAETARPEPEGRKEKISRTPGLKLFDVFLYPVLTNGAVFVISVAATYLTTRGGNRDANGKLVYGKVGEFLFKRGEWLKNKFMKVGMTENQADMSKMVAFSFIDGSLMAPVVKVFEDRREDIGRAIDKKLGTHLDDNDAAYEAEPKQSWRSVLGGRFATVSIVVPTAVALDKTGLNDVLFTKPGLKIGQYLAKKPGLAKIFGKLDIPELGRIGAFEAFYTSVCTAGVYFSSRYLARMIEKKADAKAATAAADTTTPVTAAPPPSDETATSEEAGGNFAQNVKRSSKLPEAPMQAFTQKIEAEPETAHVRA